MKLFSFSPVQCLSFPSEISAENTGRGLQILKNIHALSYNELKITTIGFRSSNKIGEGGFGSVYKGRLQDGSVVAVKMLSVESKQGQKEFMSEIASMVNICHENLVKLHGGCIDGPCRILVNDCMGNNSLSQTLLAEEKNGAKISWTARREITLGIAGGLSYVHEEIKPHIVHRDIKASNILLDQNFSPKILDFGLSKLFPEDITRVTGTLGYLSPKYAVSGNLTRKSDVYSFGVLFEIISGQTSVDFDIEVGVLSCGEEAKLKCEILIHPSRLGKCTTHELQHLVDHMLNGNFSEKEAIRFLKVGLLCVQEKSTVQPRMSTAIKMMNGEIEINEVQISQPGLISAIMDVKVSQQRLSQCMMRTPQLYPFVY